MLRNMISALLQEKLQLKEFVLHQNQSILPRVHSLQNVLIIQLFQKRVQAIQTVQVHLEAIVRLEVQAAQAPAIQSQVLIVQNQVQVEPIQEVLEQANQVQDHQVLPEPLELDDPEPIQEVLEQANQVQDHQVLRAPVKLQENS